MPYDPTDPRSQLASPASVSGVAPGIPRPATYRELHAGQPDQVDSGGARTWWTRSQALVVAQTEAGAGSALTVSTSGEYMAIVHSGANATVQHGDDRVSTSEPSVVVVPPGESIITLDTDGIVVRIFAAALEPELADRCWNADDYAERDPNVAVYAAWPDPPSGYRVRSYPLAAYPPEPGRLGRIFRCTTVMVNVFEHDPDPRDPSKLSPHHHADFEQVSLQAEGDYVHHMRVPWTPDSTTWRDDEHHHTLAPAMVVIPPPLVHTSQSVGTMNHWLIDLFAPPRADFSNRPGWVLNGDEYPMPA
jgi:hypothetical protein